MSRRARSWFGIALGLGCLAITACQVGAGLEDLGDEWRGLRAEQAKIIFLAPKLDPQKALYLRGISEDKTYSVELAFWTGPGLPRNRAIVLHVWAHAGHALTTEEDPKGHIENDSAFAGRDLAFGGLERHVGPLGPFLTRSFRSGDTDCVTFSVYWGPKNPSRKITGSDRVLGYYCADQGQAVGEDFSETLVQRIGIKDFVWPIYDLPESVP